MDHRVAVRTDEDKVVHGVLDLPCYVQRHPVMNMDESFS